MCACAHAAAHKRTKEQRDKWPKQQTYEATEDGQVARPCEMRAAPRQAFDAGSHTRSPPQGVHPCGLRRVSQSSPWPPTRPPGPWMPRRGGLSSHPCGVGRGREEQAESRGARRPAPPAFKAVPARRAAPANGGRRAHADPRGRLRGGDAVASNARCAVVRHMAVRREHAAVCCVPHLPWRFL